MKYLLMVVLLFSFNQVRADETAFMIGSRLLENCEAWIYRTDVSKAGICLGYVQGVSDAHNAFLSWETIEKHYCHPGPGIITVGQLSRIVTKHLQENPKDLHLMASSSVINALILAFPCE